MTPAGLDWGAVLSGEPLQWLLDGLVATLALTLVGGLLAGVVAVGVLALRIAPALALRWPAIGLIEVMRNTPLLVQLLFWYFAGYGLLPEGVRDWINLPHPWASLPGGASVIAPEFLTAAWGLGLFFGVFIAEELRAGLAAVAPGQAEAARAQGLRERQVLLHILMPQAMRNAWQPIVGQLLNLMKLSSLASAIGLAEITYQVRQIESFNARGFEAMAAGALLYLVLGFGLGRLLTIVGPRSRTARALGHAA